MSEERHQQLLMGLIDGELDANETREINEALRRNQSLREEYEALLETNQRLETLQAPELDEKTLRKVWRSPYRKWMRWFSYSIISMGFLAILTAGIIEFWKEREESLLLVGSFAGIGIGLGLLFFQVLRDRMIVFRNDPYRQIEK